MDTAGFSVLADRVGLFHGLSAEDVSTILSRGVTIRVLKGETIFYKGSYGSQLYVVLAGRLSVRDGSRMIATLGMGDLFGEMAVVNNEPRSASVVALEDTHLFALSEATFQHLLTKRVSIQILLNIVRTLSHRLRESNKRVPH